MWRAKIVLLTADGHGTSEIMRRTGKSKSVAWRRQERFMHAGVDGLLKDNSRLPGKKPLPRSVIERTIELTGQPPPGAATHWTAGAMAKAVGISISSVQRIWSAHGLKPHQLRTFKRCSAARRRPRLSTWPAGNQTSDAHNPVEALAPMTRHRPPMLLAAPRQ